MMAETNKLPIESANAIRAIDGGVQLTIFLDKQFTNSTKTAVETATQWLKNGKKVSVEFAKIARQRSLDSNRYFHLLLGKIAVALGIGEDECKRNLVLDYGTVLVDADGLPKYMCLRKGTNPLDVNKYPKWIASRSLNGFDLDVYVIYKPTHELNTAEMARLIEGTIQEAKQLGIETATPAEIAKMQQLWEAEYGKTQKT